MKNLTRSALALLLALSACASGPSTGPGADGVVERTIDGQTVAFKVVGFKSDWVDRPTAPREDVAELYDCAIVGGGLAGLTSAWYLRDKKIIVLERKSEAGGLAFSGTTDTGVIYGRGSAYYSAPEDRHKKIYEDLGLTPTTETAIPEPIDSYWWNGKLYEGVWEEECLKHLPEGFAKFKAALESTNTEVPNQPIEKGKKLRLDAMTAAEFIKPYGPELKDFLDSYCQSALGAKTDDVNALAFCNFYLSEITTRYAWPGGTAGGSGLLVRKLRDLNPAIVSTSSTVTSVKNDGDGVELEYFKGDRNFRLRAKTCILATSLRVTAALQRDYPEDRRKLVSQLKYADYLVHNLFTSKEHFTKSYDTWFPSTTTAFTDLIVARWIETKGFKASAKAAGGILSMYQPLMPQRGVKELTPDAVAGLGAAAYKDLLGMLPELKNEKDLVIESYRWPGSIHIVPANFFKEWVPKLTPPVGRVFYATNNLGTPSFEEAMYRGWKAAQDIREKKLLGAAPRRTAEPALAR